MRTVLSLVCLMGSFVSAWGQQAELTSVLRPSDYSLSETGESEPGAWGRLEVTAAILEPPPAAEVNDAVSFLESTWDFPGINPGQLPQAMEHAGLGAEAANSIMSMCMTSPVDGHAFVEPTDAMMLGLGSDDRYCLYSMFRESKKNGFYKRPFQMNTRFESAWFDHAGLSTGTLALVRQLVYRHNGVAYFSDFPFALARIGTAEERKDFHTALRREVTLRVRVKVPAPEDVAGLTEYWGSPERQKVIFPILDAASRGSSSWPIPIVALLPPFAQLRLNTFDHSTDQAFRDCNWTALNYFHNPPDDRLLEPEYASRHLTEGYHPVTSGFAMGDMILLRNREGTVVHACNYIADNIVFTKNGGNKDQPWILSTLRDVINYYTIGDDVPEFLFLREEPHS